MKFLSRLFKREKTETETPNSNYLVSSIASTLDGFYRQNGLSELLKPETAICLDDEYRVVLSQAVDALRKRQHLRSVVFLKDLEFLPHAKDTLSDPFMLNSPLADMAIDNLASEIIRGFRSQGAI